MFSLERLAGPEECDSRGIMNFMNFTARDSQNRPSIEGSAAQLSSLWKPNLMKLPPPRSL